MIIATNVASLSLEKKIRSCGSKQKKVPDVMAGLGLDWVRKNSIDSFRRRRLSLILVMTGTGGSTLVW